jgi:hypothetical protein
MEEGSILLRTRRCWGGRRLAPSPNKADVEEEEGSLLLGRRMSLRSMEDQSFFGEGGRWEQ